MDRRQRDLVLLISIHALRKESDHDARCCLGHSSDFNPRSP